MLILIGTPKGIHHIHENFLKIGLLNHRKEIPLLIQNSREKSNPNVSKIIFEANGIPLIVWHNKQSEIETALNIHIIKIEQGKYPRQIIIYSISGNTTLPDSVYWKDSYLNPDDFILLLGVSLTETVQINLTQIPHILLGGSTGSGKSVLLKVLIMQCIKKNARIYVADFKGGVDYTPTWHKKCTILTKEKDLLNTLTSVVDEL